MKIRRVHLRECARTCLEQRDFRVELKSGAGINPGARLRIYKGTEQLDVAVRTSLDRKVGLTRYPDGHWVTIPDVDEVIVAAPSAEEPGSAEVLGFDPDVMLRAFDAALTVLEKERLDFSPKAPIFIALDASDRGRFADVTSGLKGKARWRTLVPLGSVPLRRSSPSEADGFIERVKREFADLNGVDVTRVTVEFRISA